MHEFAQRRSCSLGTRLGMTYYTYPPDCLRPAGVETATRPGRSLQLRPDELDPAVREWALKIANSHARAWGLTPRPLQSAQYRV